MPPSTTTDKPLRAHAEFATVNPDFPVLAARTRNFSLGEPRSIQFVPNSSLVFFLRSGSQSFAQDLFALESDTGEERVLLSADSLLGGAAEQLSVEEKARRERMRQMARGIASYQLSSDGRHVLIPLSGELFIYDVESGAVDSLNSDSGYPLSPSFSPDGKSIATIRDRDLYVTDRITKNERRLTYAKHDEITNGLSEFVAQEEMGRLAGYWWSPDGKQIVYQQTDTSPVEKLHIANAVHPERPPQRWPYPRAGTANAITWLHIMPTDGGQPTWINWNRDHYPYLVNVRWTNNAPLTIQVQNREQTKSVLYQVDENTGATTQLLEETDSAWINIDQQMPRWLEDGTAFFWTTERRGQWQLELRNADGSLRYEITQPAFGYRSFVSYIAESRELLVYASDSPLDRHVYSIQLAEDGEPSTPTKWTDAPGLHSLIADAGHKQFIRRVENLSDASSQELTERDGKPIAKIESRADQVPFEPQVELTTIGADKMFHAAIVRPSDFQRGQKYPIIESVYGGPHANYVTKSGRRYLQDQWLADHGFIVVRLDTRGTPKRGRDWERAIKGNLIEIPLAEHAAGIRALAKRYPEMDINRVGIQGWSFGGYFSAMAVMREPGLYKAGIAGAPVVQWEDYDTHYTERYMGLPQRNEAGYRSANVLTYTEKLTRPLLLIHGTTDDNVYFMHSLKLSDALYRAGIPYEFLPLSNFTHMVADPQVAAQRAYRALSFFTEHLKP